MINHFIDGCRNSGIEFSLGNAGKLKVNGDKSALTAEMVNKIKVAKADIIAYLKTQQIAELDRAFQAKVPNRAAILQRLGLQEQDIEGFYPLVPLQEGMLLQHMLSEKNDTYIKYFILKLNGKETVEQVLECFRAINQRHTSCRTAIVWRGVERAYQLVKKQVELPVTYIECADQNAFEQQLEALKSAEKTMDLEREPLTRVHVLSKAGSDEHILYIEKHHIVSDSMSLEITLFELLAFYQKRQAQLPPAKQQHEFALVLEQQQLSDNGYFDTLLEGFAAPNLLFNIAKTHVDPDFIEECVYEHVIAAELEAGIREQAKQLGVSSSIVFHYAWAMVLAKFCDSKDVVFPSVMTGRMMVPEYRTTIGMFLNSLPLRVKFDSRSIGEQLVDLNLQLVQAYQYEQIPLDRAIQKLTDEFGTVFNCIFNYRHLEDQRLLDELPFEPVIAKDKSSTPFFLSVTETKSEFKIDLDIYRGTNGMLLVRALELALEHIVGALAEQGASNAPFVMPTLLGNDEVRYLVDELNDTQLDYPKDQCFHQLIEQQAEKKPDNIAIVFDDKMLSYRELNQQANQLAHYLVEQHQVKADTLVGLCVERSFEMIVGILAIVKAGGCYVPFDIEHGAEIVNARVHSHNVGVTLCSNHTMAMLTEGTTQMLNINQLLDGGVAQYSQANLALDYNSESLAYAMSSSGTTGKPKLIGLPHRALVNLISSIVNDNDGFSGEHKVLQFSSVGFDMSYTDLALALMQGGSLHLISEQVRFDVKVLAEIINRHQITLLNLPASIVNVLAEVCVERQVALPSVKMVISTAEKLEMSATLKAFFTANPQMRLTNHFGPTETHVCTTYNFAADTEQWPQEVPIGYPIGNSQCYVLDSDQTLTPNGVVGELYVGGDCLAQGYLGNGPLTEQKFIAKTRPDLGSARLYRTGDLVKWVDGQLMYVGRADDQIKLNGYRIELNDIRQQIKLHPEVNNAAVVFDKKLDHLIGYFSSEALDEQQLKVHLLNHMPSYMVPRFLLKVDGFKLTVNGKIDKSALPSLDAVYAQREYVAPQTEMEKTIISRIAELIDVDANSLSTSESFLNLGGNSILSIRLSQSLATTFDIEPPLILIMESNSIKELALELDLIVGIKNQAPLEPSEDLVEEAW